MKTTAKLALGVAVAVTSPAVGAPIHYRTATVDGVDIAYRESGTVNKPTLLLLHGVPSSSRMYDALMRRLGNDYHMVAPDYPGFGNSDAPDSVTFEYTFDHLSKVIGRFTQVVGLERYVLFMQDYGAPIGMRMAIDRPNAIMGMIFQNGNVYAEGLGPMWEKRKAFWADPDTHEHDVIEAHQSLAVTRARHLGTDPDVESYDPDLWMDEHAYLNRPGQGAIQSALIFDYQNNIAAYPAWQTWLKAHQLPTLVLWGRYDPAFTVDGAKAFQHDLPKVQIEILDAGHFVMDTHLDDVVNLTKDYMLGNKVLLDNRCG